jgi:hypothetical protein
MGTYDSGDDEHRGGGSQQTEVDLLPAPVGEEVVHRCSIQSEMKTFIQNTYIYISVRRFSLRSKRFRLTKQSTREYATDELEHTITDADPVSHHHLRTSVYSTVKWHLRGL